MDPIFATKENVRFPAVDFAKIEEMRARVVNEYGITVDQIAEAASYSQAMVVRYALGLSASDGKIAVFAANSLCGAVSLATARHLINAGASANVYLLGGNPDDAVARQLKPLTKMGVKIERFDLKRCTDFRDVVDSSHNVLCGFADDKESDRSVIETIVDHFNESKTPIHCVDRQPGVDPQFGTQSGVPLFASSTIALGAPAAGHFHGDSFVGRHYLCDISIPAQLYNEVAGFDLSPLFSDQPVIQIFPQKETESQGAA